MGKKEKTKEVRELQETAAEAKSKEKEEQKNIEEPLKIGVKLQSAALQQKKYLERKTEEEERKKEEEAMQFWANALAIESEWLEAQKKTSEWLEAQKKTEALKKERINPEASYSDYNYAKKKERQRRQRGQRLDYARIENLEREEAFKRERKEAKWREKIKNFFLNIFASFVVEDFIILGFIGLLLFLFVW